MARAVRLETVTHGSVASSGEEFPADSAATGNRRPLPRQQIHGRRARNRRLIGWRERIREIGPAARHLPLCVFSQAASRSFGPTSRVWGLCGPLAITRNVDGQSRTVALFEPNVTASRGPQPPAACLYDSSRAGSRFSPSDHLPSNWSSILGVYRRVNGSPRSCSGSELGDETLPSSGSAEQKAIR